MQEKTFHEIELESWSRRAEIYDRLFAEMTKQAIEPILEGMGGLAGIRHLDLACGTGHLVAAAAQRGADSQGLDFTPAMIDAARRNFPNLKFSDGDAQNLIYADETFDVVTCSFGLNQMDRPHAAIREAYRVLRPGGRFLFTIWRGAKDGNEFQGMVERAFAEHGVPGGLLPQASSSVRFASLTECREILEAAGFVHPATRILPLTWQTTRPEDVLALMDKLSVHTSMMLEAQPKQAQDLIRHSVLEQCNQYWSNGLIVLAWPAILTAGVKPHEN